jgi:hypothetical protein
MKFVSITALTNVTLNIFSLSNFLEKIVLMISL